VTSRFLKPKDVAEEFSLCLAVGSRRRGLCPAFVCGLAADPDGVTDVGPGGAGLMCGTDHTPASRGARNRAPPQSRLARRSMNADRPSKRTNVPRSSLRPGLPLQSAKRAGR